MGFMHDGAPVYFSKVVPEFLTAPYADRWNGQGGSQLGLNPPDYYLWDHLKSIVYTTLMKNMEDLRNRTIAGSNSIKIFPGDFEIDR